MISLEMIHRARERIKPYVYKTPLIRLENLEEYLGCQVYLKMESLQKTNSFKVRGAVNRLMTLPEEALKKGIVTASSGNHGKAVAYAGKQLGVSVHIVVPENAPAIKVEGMRSYGAEVIFSSLSERFTIAEKLSKENGWTFISPFDDYEIMAGQGTAGLEILEQLPDVDYVVAPIGGGGLIGGLSAAIKETNPRVKIIGAEPAAVARYTKSFAVGQPVTLDKSSVSVADGLQTLRPGTRNYPVVQKYVDRIVTVDEEYLLKATKMLLTEGKILAEISACITLGAVLQGAVNFKPEDKFENNQEERAADDVCNSPARPAYGEKVVFFLSGGNIGMDQFKKFENQ